MNKRIGRPDWEEYFGVVGMSEIVQLGTVVEINPESISKNFPHEEIEYIDISSVGTGRLEGVRKIPIKDAPSRAKRLVNDGDTILSTVRPNRRSFLYIKKSKPNTVVSTGFAVLRANEKIDERFLYYLINHQAFTDYLTNRAKGAAYPAVDNEIISNAEVPLPPLPTQHKIASILSAYDDLIANNTRRIAILEEMAQRIYKEWFVDFKYPGHENDEMVGSLYDGDVIEIPVGWKVGSVSDLYDVRSGFAFKSSHMKDFGDYGIVKIKNLQNNTVDLINIQFIEKENIDNRAWNFKLDDGDLLIAMTGAQVGKIGLMPKLNNIYLLNQRVGKFFPKDNKQKTSQFIYQVVQSTDFQKSVDNIAQGAAQPNISGSGIGQIEIILPSIKYIEKYENITQPLMDEIISLDYKNKNLSQTRDLLLPKLISGQVDVSELDIDVGAEA